MSDTFPTSSDAERAMAGANGEKQLQAVCR